MFKLTCITLEDGVCALYINGQYLGADDCSDERFSLGDILERLSRLPGVSVETATRPVPQNADWRWMRPSMTTRSMPPWSVQRTVMMPISGLTGSTCRVLSRL